MTPRDLSVIVVSFNARETIGACLRALGGQTVKGFRTLVVDSSSDGTAELVRREFTSAGSTGVELIHSKRRLYPGDARNAGLQRATSALVAFVDADCIAAPDWVERIVAAHTGSELIIGGSVGVANPGSLAGWAIYFCEFSGWIPQGRTRHLADIPTCCLSFKRAAYDHYGPFLEGSYCSDTLFNWKAGEGGHRPLFVPEIHVQHHNLTALRPILRKLRMHGETFARVRVRHGRWGRGDRFARAATWVLLPGWLWLRTSGRVARAPGYRWPFLRATPWVLAGLVCWSWGEAVGYLRSPEAEA